MKLFHTSPAEITEINNRGIAGQCLFFSADIYSMSAAAAYVYSLEVADDEIISASELHDEAIIARIAEFFEVDADTAERLLDGRESEWGYGADAEASWWLQGMRGECAAKMGYVACEDEDEQGTVYIIAMKERVQDLSLEH